MCQSTLRASVLCYRQRCQQSTHILFSHNHFLITHQLCSLIARSSRLGVNMLDVLDVLLLLLELEIRVDRVRALHLG